MSKLHQLLSNRAISSSLLSNSPWVWPKMFVEPLPYRSPAAEALRFSAIELGPEPMWGFGPSFEFGGVPVFSSVRTIGNGRLTTGIFVRNYTTDVLGSAVYGLAILGTGGTPSFAREIPASAEARRFTPAGFRWGR